MRTIIAGSRHITDYHVVTSAIIESGFMYDITEVICGGAPGVDLLGDQFAFEVGLPVSYYIITDRGFYDFTPLKNLQRVDMLAEGAAMDSLESYFENVTVASDWYIGHVAARYRNERMAKNADALIAVRGKDPRTGEPSRGTTMMINLARQHGLKVHIKEIE